MEIEGLALDAKIWLDTIEQCLIRDEPLLYESLFHAFARLGNDLDQICTQAAEIEEEDQEANPL